MGGFEKDLYNDGLTNYDSEDIGVLAFAKKREEFSKFCMSVKCCTYYEENSIGKLIKKQRYRGVRKETSKDTCPDCENFLVVKKRGSVD